MSDPWRLALKRVLAGWAGGIVPVCVSEAIHRSAPLLVVQELVGLLLCAALLAGAGPLGARATSAKRSTRALIALCVLVATGLALALLFPPWIVLALPWAMLPVAAGLLLAQLRTEPSFKRPFAFATWGAVVGLTGLHLLRSSPWGAALFELRPHVPMLFGVWGILVGLMRATDERPAFSLPVGSGLLLLFMWAIDGSMGYSADRVALHGGGPETRKRALASMAANGYMYSLGLKLRSNDGGDSREDLDHVFGILLVFPAAVWPSRVERPAPADVRGDLLRAVGDHLQARFDRRAYLFQIIEGEARFQSDPAVRQIALETVKRLEPGWRDPVEVWATDPDPEKRKVAYIAISADLYRLSADELRKVVSRADELHPTELQRLLGCNLDDRDRSRIETLLSAPSTDR